MTDEPEAGAQPKALDESAYARWLATAESNLASARREAAAEAHHVAVLLAEQAARCATKAVLHGVGATARAHGHGLVTLGGAVAAEIGSALPDPVLEAMQRLSQAYMPSRYPDALPDGSPVDYYGSAHSKQALDDAAEVMAFDRESWAALLAAQRASRGPQADEGANE